MTFWPKLALALMPGGCVALAAMALLRCRHRHEVLSQLRAEKPEMGLRCSTCLRTRPHPWGSEPVRYHRTQEARPEPMTGIEREAERQKQQAAAVAETIALLEWRERQEQIKAKVHAWREAKR